MSSIGAILGTAAVTLGRGVAAAAGDGLSFAGELLKAVGGEQPAEPAPAAENPLTARIDALRDRLRRFLAAAGVDLSQPVELVSDGLGGIAVAGPHPQQAAIEAALDSDVLLERDFQQLASESLAGNGTGLQVVVSPSTLSLVPGTGY
jgi:hypothetical protein